MPRPRSLSSFPAEYISLFQKWTSLSEGETITLHPASRKEARTVRGNLYAFRSALRRSPNPIQSALGRAASDLIFQINGNNIIISRKEDIILSLSSNADFLQRDSHEH